MQYSVYIICYWPTCFILVFVNVFAIACAAVTTERWGRSGNSYDGTIVERSKPKKVKVGF